MTDPIKVCMGLYQFSIKFFDQTTSIFTILNKLTSEQTIFLLTGAFIVKTKLLRYSKNSTRNFPNKLYKSIYLYTLVLSMTLKQFPQITGHLKKATRADTYCSQEIQSTSQVTTRHVFKTNQIQTMLLRRQVRRIEKAFFATIKTQIEHKPSLAYGERVVFQGPAAEPLLTTEQAELPKINEGEILGKIKAATICGSDLHTFLGKRNEPFPR